MTVTDDGKVWFACAGTNTATGGIITFDGSTWSHLNTLNSTFYDDYILGIGSYGNTVVIPDHHDLFIYNGSNWTQIGSWFTDLPWNAGPYSEMIEVGQKIYVCSDKGILEINGPALTTVEEKNQSIYLYPNPSYEIININDPNQVIIDYKIFDLSGRIVCESTELFIPVHQFDSGEYIIKFNCVDGNELIRSLHVVH
ncbi:MAG: T9SS type A sorting domain-containing protein [Crocinitomicaceae bacterium]|nr:T9SS type A sorting domain-containing protein [Crocinitomicaceae bacterium]